MSSSARGTFRFRRQFPGSHHIRLKLVREMRRNLGQKASFLAMIVALEHLTNGMQPRDHLGFRVWNGQSDLSAHGT